MRRWWWEACTLRRRLRRSMRTVLLGVDDGDPLTNLNADVTTHDLGEFDQLFRTLGLAYKGKKGMDVVPLKLHGDAHFHGTASGPVEMLDVKGHLDAQNLELTLPTMGTPPPPPAQPITDRLAGLLPCRGCACGCAATTACGDAQRLIDSVVAMRSSYRRADRSYGDGKARVGDADGVGQSAAAPVHRASRRWSTTGTMPRSSTRRWICRTASGTGCAGYCRHQGAAERQDEAQRACDRQLRQSEWQRDGVADERRFLWRAVSACGGGSQRYGQDIRQRALCWCCMARRSQARATMTCTRSICARMCRPRGLKLGQFQTVATAKVAVDGNLSLQADADGTLEEPGLHATMQSGEPDAWRPAVWLGCGGDAQRARARCSTARRRSLRTGTSI